MCPFGVMITYNGCVSKKKERTTKTSEANGKMTRFVKLYGGDKADVLCFVSLFAILEESPQVPAL